MLLHLKIKTRTCKWCDCLCQAGAAADTISQQSLPHAKGYVWHNMGWTDVLYVRHSTALCLHRVTATQISNCWTYHGLPLRVITATNSHTDFSKPNFLVSYSLPYIPSHLPSRQTYYKMFQPKQHIIFSENTFL